MAKAGDTYQKIVDAVARALDPGASVQVGQWIDGPDGRRDLDVKISGAMDGSPRLVLVECKDWARHIGIKVVDEVESKRRDLAADRAIIFSNSGFTGPALRKASRVGIEMASALIAGDNRIKVAIERSIVAKRLAVDSMRARMFSFPGELVEIEDRWNVDQLLCDNLPVKNWISDLSRQLILENEDAKSLTFRCTFPSHRGWVYDGREVRIAALELVFLCSKKWYGQIVRVDVSTGLYDYLRRTVTVPDKQSYSLGWIDNEAWVEVDSAPEEKEELEPNTFELYFTLLNHIPPIVGAPAPDIDRLIIEKEIIVDANNNARTTYA